MATTTKPLPRKKRVLNRGFLYSRSGDDVKNPSVSLMDIDSAIVFYFENVIQPSVIDNEESVKVPIMYASPERWKSIQRDGFMRDRKRQILTPVIVYRRTSIEKDDTLPIDKLDANNPNLFYTFEKKFSNVNRYDNFSTQIGNFPSREYYNVTVPDYVTLSYDFIIWTSYIEQMNSIVEKVVYSDGAYWGDPEKMRFRTSIDSFTDATEISDTERLVRTNFTVTLKGYLLPEGNFDHRSTTQKYLSPKRVVFSENVDTTVEKNIGLAGQFRDELDSKNVSLPSAESSENLGITLTNPLTFSAGTGVTLSPVGLSFDGSSSSTLTISIGQAVATNSSVVFNSVSASSFTLGSMTINDGVITSTNLRVTGSVTNTGNLTVNGNATIAGTLTAQEIKTEFVSASILFSSGSTKFGDGLDDNHNFTGSIQTSGSFNLNNYSVNEISNDTTLNDASSTALVTENAAKTYVNNNAISQQTYLRKNFVKSTNSITAPSTASFNAVTASAPSDMTATSENDFVFFINGQYMEHDALTIKQSGANLLLLVDNGSIGYDLETDDEILAVGKFNS
mgnify:FL=1|tara:strand:+ start:249 stop:1940 length:1692 start_codon:yes stop_codon:yes gene_type:complete